MIKNIVFDFGGVIARLSRESAVRKFTEIGVEQADSLIGQYHQQGIFLEIEEGTITKEVFYDKLCLIAGKKITPNEIDQAWLAFITEVPQYKLDYILELKQQYNLYLLSNTNPIVMHWARSSNFTPAGKLLDEYFHKLYCSYEVGVIKPDRAIFDFMINDARIKPQETLFIDDSATNCQIGHEIGFKTYQPFDGEDWREPINKILAK